MTFNEGCAVVSLYIPTYRNASVFEACLDSYLRQSHRDIEINIFDNSLADGYSEIRDLVEGKGDSRIRYLPNLKNIGASGNYRKIIESVNPSTFAIILSADMGLADNAVEKMLEMRAQNHATIVYPRTLNHDYRIKNEKGISSYQQKSELIYSIFKSARVLSGQEVLRYYFSKYNIDGDFFSYSLFGSLVFGKEIKSLDGGCWKFKFHGFEQYVSMNLALNCPKFYFSDQPLLKNFIGQPRFQTERPVNNFTRLEPILACEIFMKNFIQSMETIGIDVAQCRRSQIEKLIYFLRVYGGWWGTVFRLLALNIFRLYFSCLKTFPRNGKL